MMTSANADTKQGTMPWQKRVADLCTTARGPLAGVLVWIGIDRGKDGIQLALLLLLVAATLDTLDGYFARLSPYPVQTWVGSHDLAFDIGFSAGLLLYLALASYVSPYLAVLYAGFWIIVFFGNRFPLSNTLAVVAQAPIYAGISLAAVLHDPGILLWIVLWVSLMLAFAGKRFFRVRLPAFFEAFLERH